MGNVNPTPDQVQDCAQCGDMESDPTIEALDFPGVPFCSDFCKEEYENENL